MVIGDWLVEPALDSISRQGQRIKLEPRMMRLLLRLAQAPGEVVSVDQLLTDVWTGVVVGPGSVYQSISLLRNYLGDEGPEPTYIATVPRKGYRLVAVVEQARPAPAGVASAAATPTPQPLAALSPDALQSGSRRNQFVLAAALAVAALFAVVIWQWSTLAAYLGARPENPTLVVLPFLDLTPEKRDQVFCDGLTEELSGLLAQLPTLSIVARTSAFAYRDKAEDIRTIGKELNAQYAIEGSVRRQGDQFRITVQLIDTRSGTHIWAGNYEPRQEDLVNVQATIARSLASNLELRLTRATSQRLSTSQSASAAAYQYYLLAQAYRQRRSREDNEHSIELYRQALNADGKFVSAYLGLATSYLAQNNFNARRLDDIADDIERLLDKVQKLDPGAPGLLLLRGRLRYAQGRYEEAEKDFGSAMESEPGNAEAVQWVAYMQYVSGKPREALRNYNYAASLDPLNAYIHAQRCMTLQHLARVEEAAAACNRAASLQPDSEWTLKAQSWLADIQGHLADALQKNSLGLRKSPSDVWLYMARMSWYSALGMPEEALSTLATANRMAASPAVAEQALMRQAIVATKAASGDAALRQLLLRHQGGDVTPQMMIRLAYGYAVLEDFVAARRWLDRAANSGHLDPVRIDEPRDLRLGYSWSLLWALVYQRTGDQSAADRCLSGLQSSLAMLRESGTETYGVYELLARIAAMRGKADEARTHLGHAIDLGWRTALWARSEPYFDRLRQDKAFDALLTQVERLNAAERARMQQ